ncbi:unnamed protein product [Bursaphelenchus xylophilus]|uniref:(pine wood nematode) hypothetical protein n=1 Tax=Bursaphelenchus xylophilus TaxID=6326 RepID=A0A1I7STH7_BURXY|nr:unnamed protein product [Bursaphelenchus xylophilus]CAG9108404.1 unnamed protein product [Bursaphelenchus xylophilus]
MSAITPRRAKEIGAFFLFLGGVHYAYYKIQNNDSLVPMQNRQELFYVQWIKDAFPSLKDKFGVKKD